MKPLSSLIVGVFFGCQCVTSLAATAEDPNLAAVHKALIYLVQQQNTDGSWGQGPDDQMKATTEVYHALSLLSTLSVPRRAAGNWIKNTLLHDTEDKARADYVKRFNGGASPGFGQTLFSSSDKVDHPIIWHVNGEPVTVGTTSTALWGPFFDYKYATIDTALSLRSLVRDIPYANPMQQQGIKSAINYLLEKRNQGDQASSLGSGWGFSSDDYSTQFESQLIPTAFALLALTDPVISWATVSEGAMSAVHWLVSKQGPEGRFGSGLSGDQYNDAETVLATLALARVRAREDTDAVISQAYHSGRDYLVGQLVEHGHIRHSPLLTALALQALPLTQITLVDQDRDQVPDAIEPALGYQLNGARFEGNQMLRGNGLFGTVSFSAQNPVFLLVGQQAEYRLVTGGGSVEVIAGQLPVGMQLTDNAQVMTGVPSVVGIYDLNYQVLSRDDGRIIRTAAVQFQVLEPDDDPDGDGLPADYELRHRMNPLSSADAASDFDLDGWTNQEEFVNGTDPWQSNPRDSDGDGIADADERLRGLDAEQADTDGDSMSDGDELSSGRNPLVNEPVLLLIQDVLL